MAKTFSEGRCTFPTKLAYSCHILAHSYWRPDVSDGDVTFLVAGRQCREKRLVEKIKKQREDFTQIEKYSSFVEDGFYWICDCLYGNT